MDDVQRSATHDATYVGQVTPHTTQHVEHENCTICLCPVSERAVAIPCNHLSFDFLCLVQWLQTSAHCPLCKAQVSEVQYDFRSIEDFKRYVVPQALRQENSTSRHHSEPYHRPHEQVDPECVRRHNPALQRRQQIYADQLYSLHVGSSAYSGYTDFTPQIFATSAHLQARARTFLRRELQALETRSSSPTRWQAVQGSSKGRGRLRQASTDYLIEFMLAVLRSHDPKSFDGRAEELVSEFMSRSEANLLLHELTNWLRSPFERLSQYDHAVQYHI